MSETLIRSLNLVVERSTGRRAVRALVGTEDLDAHGTVIDPAGVDLGVFRANPVVLLDHGLDGRHGRIPVGRAERIELVQDPRDPRRTALEATVKFREDSESQRVWEAYADGSMRGFSVNITADGSRAPSKAEIRARPELARCTHIYTSGVLRELSATAVPSNPGALVMEVMRSMGGSSGTHVSDAMARQLVADWKRSLGETEKAVRKAIASMSEDELLAYVQRLKLEHSAVHLENLRESQDRRREHEASYAAMGREKGRIR